MDASYDVLLTCLPSDVNDIVIRNFFRTIGKVTKVKILDDKKDIQYKICYVGFETIDDAQNAARLAHRSTAFGDPIRASVSKKSIENFETNKSMKSINGFVKGSCNNADEVILSKGFNSLGRGRGIQFKKESLSPSFTTKSIKLNDIKFKSKELIDIEIIDLSNLECIFARPLKYTENSKSEITDILKEINVSQDILLQVDCPKEGDYYLGKWDDGLFYRAELLNNLDNGNYKVAFIDEGTSGDIISDLRYIPEGKLQNYPKQFSKISIGCKDSDNLRNFIMEESTEKSVRIFWLGDYLNGVPLINLFLGDEEVVEKFIQLNKIPVRDSFALKFKDVPNHKSNTDCSHVTWIQSLYKSQLDFTVQIKDAATISCHKRIPSILPTTGDLCIYEKRNGVNNVNYFRCVVRRRQLFSFDIILFDVGEQITNVSIDCLYAAEDCHKVDPPFAIMCELDKSLGYSEDMFHKIICDENMKFSILTYKGNNRYLVTASVIRKELLRFPDINLKKFIGQSFKVLVTHLVSPLNFYVQVDKSEYVQTLNDIHERINISYNGARFSSLDSISVGQAIVAPFSVDGSVGENFRATVLEVRAQMPQLHVYYIDYGNDGWVDYKEIFDVDEEIAVRPALALHCTLDVDLRKEAWNHAIELFSRIVGYIDNDSCELVMQVTGDSDGKLIVDLTSLVKGSITMALVKSGTCFVKDNGKGVVAKPVCNGEVKTVSKESHSTLKPEITSNHLMTPASNTADDYGTLLKKINDLENRLAFLENYFQND